jgi:hypothetical protein
VAEQRGRSERLVEQAVGLTVRGKVLTEIVHYTNDRAIRLCARAREACEPGSRGYCGFRCLAWTTTGLTTERGRHCPVTKLSPRWRRLRRLLLDINGPAAAVTGLPGHGALRSR